MNPAESAVVGAQEAWAEASAEMGFGEYADIARGPDSKDENLLNHAIWYGTMGFDTPYPGEDRVLLPSEVQPALEEDEDEAEREFESGGAGQPPAGTDNR